MSYDNELSSMISYLENKGYIRLSNMHDTIGISSVDPKEGYAYITDDHKKFVSSRDAIVWAMSQLEDLNSI